VRVAELLGELTRTQWYRWRGRAPSWRVLHSVPLLDARGRGRGDIDHVLIGPPGVVTVNTKHHRAGRLELDRDDMVVNGRPTEYVRKARLEALRAAELLRAALVDAGAAELAGRLVVRPLLAIVGGRLLVSNWPAGVTVVMTRQLVPILRGMPPVLDAGDVEAVFRVGTPLDHLGGTPAVRPGWRQLDDAPPARMPVLRRKKPEVFLGSLREGVEQHAPLLGGRQRRPPDDPAFRVAGHADGEEESTIVDDVVGFAVIRGERLRVAPPGERTSRSRRRACPGGCWSRRRPRRVHPPNPRCVGTGASSSPRRSPPVRRSTGRSRSRGR
jgi:hypothetical protein